MDATGSPSRDEIMNTLDAAHVCFRTPCHSAKRHHNLWERREPRIADGNLGKASSRLTMRLTSTPPPRHKTRS
jgi:hypothetical protein